MMDKLHSALDAYVIRGLNGIARELCPDKPFHKKYILELIHEHGLPAVKRKPGGWVVSRRALRNWLEIWTGGCESK
jgi:hypothetical protein